MTNGPKGFLTFVLRWWYFFFLGFDILTTAFERNPWHAAKIKVEQQILVWVILGLLIAVFTWTFLLVLKYRNDVRLMGKRNAKLDVRGTTAEWYEHMIAKILGSKEGGDA